jgi:hypothetical protein
MHDVWGGQAHEKQILHHCTQFVMQLQQPGEGVFHSWHLQRWTQTGVTQLTQQQ